MTPRAALRCSSHWLAVMQSFFLRPSVPVSVIFLQIMGSSSAAAIAAAGAAGAAAGVAATGTAGAAGAAGATTPAATGAWTGTVTSWAGGTAAEGCAGSVAVAMPASETESPTTRIRSFRMRTALSGNVT